MNSDFFQGYKRTSLYPNELLVSVLIPFTREVCWVSYEGGGGIPNILLL